MKVLIFFCCILCTFSLTSLTVPNKKKIRTLDVRWICSIKKSCVDCLQIPNCTWCASTNVCFSKTLYKSENICQNGNTTDYVDYELSVAENAACLCGGGETEKTCRPLGATKDLECSGRGKCVCGRCICDIPYPEQPTKMIMGELCEFDNFSCDGPHCNEGPYSITAPRMSGIEKPFVEAVEPSSE